MGEVHRSWLGAELLKTIALFRLLLTLSALVLALAICIGL